jgi:hypothetical protein
MIAEAVEVLGIPKGESVEHGSNRRDWKFHAERISAAWGKQVASILETGQALIDAKDELEYGSFEAMVQQKLPFEPRTARRLMAIAKCNLLRTHVSDLPASWGTLYELTRLPLEMLRAKLNDGTINPKTERKDVARWRAELRGKIEVDGKTIGRKPPVAEQLKTAKAEIGRLKQIVGGEHLFDPSNTSDRQIAETMIGRLEGWRGRARKVAKLMLEILDQQKRGGKMEK